MAQKVGEEATEVVIAALTGSREALVGEAADLVFHLLVLLAASDVSLADVVAELERREGLSTAAPALLPAADTPRRAGREPPEKGRFDRERTQ